MSLLLIMTKTIFSLEIDICSDRFYFFDNLIQFMQYVEALKLGVEINEPYLRVHAFDSITN